MTITWKGALMGIAVLAVIGVVVLVSGVVPIKASSGHWPITAWFLNFASDRSIAFHSTGLKTEPPDGGKSVMLGAATYQSNCQFCHGQPGQGRPPMANGMTPTPPRLAETAPDFERNELFYILKHGIKFAGMPAWPTQKRDDEIWPVVDFLQRLPEMSQREYLELVSPTSVSDDALTAASEKRRAMASKTQWIVARRCAACHGIDGNGRAGDRVPKLAGQSESYLRQTLEAYRSNRRYSGIMMPIAYRLEDHEIEKLASYFSAQTLRTDVEATADGADRFDPDQIKQGGRLAEQGSQKSKIASCVDCHGPGKEIDNPEYPQLAGQPMDYLLEQLKLFARRSRGGSENATLMHPIADKLDSDQRQALAAFYSAARPDSVAWPSPKRGTRVKRDVDATR